MSAEQTPKKGFMQRELPAVVFTWNALGYLTGFAATVASVPVSIPLMPFIIKRNKELATEGQDGVGLFPLVLATAENMKKVGKTINTLALIGVTMCGLAKAALQIQPEPNIQEPTPLIWVTDTPIAATPLPPGLDLSTATPLPLTCVTIGEQVPNAGRAWQKLGKPKSILFENLAGPDGDGSETILDAKHLPSLVHNGDKFCTR